LHLDPRRRCSLAEIQARLQPAARSVPAELEPLRPARRPLRRGPIAAALLAAAIVVGLIVFISRGKSVPSPAAATTEQPASQPSVTAAPTPAPKPPVSRSAEPPKKSMASGGEVLHKVIPEVSQRTRNTITGTVKVGVRVEVDSSGQVTAAKLTSPGPSKYFAGLAVKAAQGWKFSPPQVDGQPTPSTWALQFRFRRTSTDAIPERVKR